MSRVPEIPDSVMRQDEFQRIKENPRTFPVFPQNARAEAERPIRVPKIRLTFESNSITTCATDGCGHQFSHQQDCEDHIMLRHPSKRMTAQEWLAQAILRMQEDQHERRN